MSHTVITTTTTTRTSGDGVLNTGYTRTTPGLLKIGQTVRVRLLAGSVAGLPASMPGCVHADSPGTG